jgi:hypothetical protein
LSTTLKTTSGGSLRPCSRMRVHLTTNLDWHPIAGVVVVVGGKAISH